MNKANHRTVPGTKSARQLQAKTGKVLGTHGADAYGAGAYDSINIAKQNEIDEWNRKVDAERAAKADAKFAARRGNQL